MWALPAATTNQEHNEIVEHFQYFELKIDPVLLDEFKQTKYRNHNWEGDSRAVFLFLQSTQQIQYEL